MTAGMDSTGHLTWPAHRFYWAVLDASVLPRGIAKRRPNPERLGYLFESELPVAIDRIHAVYLPVGDNRYVACGVEHERIHAEASLHEALTLTPDQVPEVFAPQGAVDPQSFNLLCGPHEPAPVRRHRRRFMAESAGIATLVLLAIVLGIERRIDARDRATMELQAKRQVVYDELYPPATSAPSAQPAPLRLLAELRQLERTRGGVTEAAGIEEPQAAFTLEALLELWPTDHPIRTESISVTPASVTLVALLPSAPLAQEFVSAFDLPDEWEARQPQISTVTDGVRLTWRLVRRESAPLASNESASADGSQR